MKSIHPYLTFNGNCREAMVFYKNCLGGELSFQTTSWLIPYFVSQLPAKMKKYILHAELSNENLILMASDIVSEKRLLKGNAISLLLNCKSEKEIKDCYQKLSTGGEQTHPLEETYWGALFGGLKDKYGNNWLLSYKRNRKNKRKQKLKT